jgi:hypothetical protein
MCRPMGDDAPMTPGKQIECDTLPMKNPAWLESSRSVVAGRWQFLDLSEPYIG